MIKIISFFFLTIVLFANENHLFKIINPSIDTIRDESRAYVVLKASKANIDNFIIGVDGNKTIEIKINSSRTNYCKTLPLSMGENLLSIKGYKAGKLVEEQKRKIFVSSKVFKEYKYPPEKFSYKFFHKEKNEKVCKKCHDMSVNEIKGVAFEDVTKSNCYQCHSSIGQKKHSHAPTVNWLCTSCHNGEVGEYNLFDERESRYTVPDPIENICLSCHKKKRELWSKMRFKHEPADSGRCNKCHNPHGSNSINYLRKPAWELCTTCHKDKIKGMHIAKTFSRVMHPTRGVKDPSRKGKELSCVSCHNPHASNSSSLLQSSSAMSLCSRCHKK